LTAPAGLTTPINPVRPPVTVAELVAAVRDQQTPSEPKAPPSEPRTGATVRVLGAHGGAGCSTVALALADELASRVADRSDVGHRETRVIDLATGGVSGLDAAAECEIASKHSGWTAGRRGRLVIYGRRVGSTPVDERMTPAEGDGHTIIDLGIPWPHSGPLGRNAAAPTVLVCRASVGGVRRAEQALAQHDGDVLLAMVGSSRWSRDLAGELGPHTTGLVDRGRCVLFPCDRRLERFGPDTSPFSRRVMAAAGHLANLVGPLTAEGVLP
jgi:hypothetical protein